MCHLVLALAETWHARCEKLAKSNLLFKEERRGLRVLVSLTMMTPGAQLTRAGEEGKVEESMKELEAVEALKAEKTEKEVRK